MSRTVSSFRPPFIRGRTTDSLSSSSVFLCSLFKAVLLLSSSSYAGSACLLSGVTLLLGTMSEHIQLSIALCRIGFYTCLQKLCCKAPPPPRPEYDVVCIGLSGAGKTSLLSRLCNEISDGTVPTTGFSIKAVPFENAILNVKELGGAETIKKYWSRYYQGSQGVVFVLNSAASDEEMEASRSELLLAMQHPQLCTLPFLILANHQDSPAARSVAEIQKFLELQPLARGKRWILSGSTTSNMEAVKESFSQLICLLEEKEVLPSRI
ncbi:ADP-ribosylation factor-like protein 15 isoform X1 [Carassius auratus]|uniref:ADP-ribosylation factor-like protein 15 n=1 Tax=Carassius auratus TaxID=7957 RepID=A0A6P6K4M7_CARAU|nr:ADP-ribosylation factor-like protein 15 isoform X1 [Carassius auratus]XP_052413231.1 ADP-ribosylation factor-like protein 15 isoform X1 [Carassius gibelio]